ncbi:MAG: hypothetical protein HUJ31_17400, partial [Pseudomonadales bacterium]|nr:hypothetical protein [Pseudomonadales bacterium]
RILGPSSSAIANNLRIRRLPPDEAFEQALELSSRERASSLMQTVSRWVHADPEAAVDRIMSLPNQQERDMLLRTALSQLARTDPDQALQLQALYEPNNQDLERTILAGFAMADPVRALVRVEQYTSRTGDLNPLSNLLGAWVQVDPPAALAYAATLPRDYDWTVHQVMASRYAAAYPEEAMDWALSLPDDMTGIKRIAINTITQRSPALAERVVDRVTDPGLRQQLIQQVASHKARQDLQAAVDWVNRTTSANSELRFNALASAAMGASGTKPEEAAALVNRLPAGSIRNNAANVVARAWSREQPEREEEIYSLLNIDRVRELEEERARLEAMRARAKAGY